MTAKILAGLMAAITFFFCATRVTAQETLTLPAGGLYRLSDERVAQAVGADYEWLVITLPPPSARGTLQLDGEPLDAHRMISREEVRRVWCFIGAGTPVSIGVSALPERLPTRSPRILCINRQI